jgi:cysteinyl-tRNA synthetase
LGLAEKIAAVVGEPLPAKVATLIQQREAARAARDWSTADALREAIRQRGYEVEDTPSGTRWRRIRPRETSDARHGT